MVCGVVMLELCLRDLRYCYCIKNKVITAYIVPLMLGTQQASSPALLDLLSHGDHARGHEPEHYQHEDIHS